MKGAFTLQDYFSQPLTNKGLITGIRKYKDALKKNPPPILDSINTFQFIQSVKRDKALIGPYTGLTLYESCNRIFSDIALLEGAQEVFSLNPEIEKVQLSLSNIRGRDFKAFLKSGISIEGEAFNVAPSFFTQKLRKELISAPKNKPFYIIFNRTAVEGHAEYLRRKREEHKGVIFILCDLRQWDQL